MESEVLVFLEDYSVHVTFPLESEILFFPIMVQVKTKAK